MALPRALAWTGMTMPTSGICRLPSGRGSWWMITTSSMSSTPVRTASPVRRARSSAHGMASRPELEGVEVDVAEPQDGGPELVAARPALLHDHPVLDQAADDAVGGRRRELQAGGQLRQAHPAGALERGQDPDGAVDRLDHGCSF